MTFFALIVLVVVLFLLIIGFIFLWRGFRGVPQFTAPKCTKCSYDLRTLDWSQEKRRCPECGADLADSKAVRFGDYRKRPKLIIAGFVMMGLPFLLVGGTVLMAVMNIRWESFESNEDIIANLANTANSPWDWRKLEGRYSTGDLSDEEVAAAIDQLIAFLKTQKSPQPLHWADTFVNTVVSNEAVDDKQYARLVDAFYGEPKVRLNRRVRQGKEKLDFSINFGQHWHLPGTKTAMELKAVTLEDGTAIPVEDRYSRGLSTSQGDIDAIIDVKVLGAGKHTLVFKVELGAFDESEKFSPVYRGRPGPAGKWPEGRRKWKLDVKVPVRILAPGEQVVKLVDDANLDPVQAGFGVDEVEILPSRQKGGQLGINIEYAEWQPPVPVVLNVIMIAAGKEYTYGYIMRGQTKSGSRSSSGSRGRSTPLKSLPADVTKVDMRFEPDPALADEQYGLDRIWGKTVLLKDVPLSRWDIDEEDE